jgi:putative hemolysin
MIIIYTSILLIFSSGFCSLAEASLVALSHIKAKTLMKNNKRIMDMIENKQDYLGAIIVANTIINVSGSVLIGGLISHNLNENLSFNFQSFNLTILSTYIIVGVNIALTYSILMFAEMLPKFWASTHPEKVLSIINFPLWILRHAMTPFLIITKGLASKLMKLPTAIETISKDEIDASIALGINKGLFADKEATLLKNAVKLTEHKISDWILDDFELKSIDENTHINCAVNNALFSKHRRILVNNSSGLITGVVLVEDVLRRYIARDDIRIIDLKHDVVTVKNDSSMVDLLNSLDLSDDHISLIVDKYDETNVVGVFSTSDLLHKLAT